MFQLAGGLVLLAAVIGLYVVSAEAGTPSYLLKDLEKLDISTEAGRWLFVGFFIAFAIKAPLFPVHTWLADTTERATPGRQRDAGVRARQDRHVRDAALLPRDLPRGLAVGHPGGRHHRA